MNIVLISRSYFPTLGGVEVHVKEIAERLAKNNNVVVYTLDKTASKLTAYEEINGVKIKRFGCKRLSYGIEIPSSEFTHTLKNSSADIIHLHSLHTLLPLYTYKVIPVNSSFIITPHYHGTGHTFTRKILFKLYKSKLSNVVTTADKLICVSNYERSLIFRDFSIQQDKVVVIPNGISQVIIDFKRTNNNERNLSKILFVGRLERYKNADKLVKALSLLDKFELVIVGDGPEKDKISKLIRRLNLSERVRIVSNLSQEELVEEYKSSGIFVMPSKYEAFGLVVAEALSMGLRAIVANSSALSEFITGGYADSISLPITPDKIAKAVNDACRKPKLNRYIAYNWDMVVRDLIDVYESSLWY
jgi:glycosyltransferase involved in cell wall biosynthesis